MSKTSEKIHEMNKFGSKKKESGRARRGEEIDFKWAWDRGLHHVIMDVKNTLQVNKNLSSFFHIFHNLHDFFYN